jgi:hypothetical protein
MKETLPCFAQRVESIERSSDWSIMQSADAALLMKCCNAPDFIRRNIDTRREARGLPPLWSTRSDERRRPGARTSDKAGSKARLAQLKAFLAKARARQQR